jgi:hypothetical protein
LFLFLFLFTFDLISYRIFGRFVTGGVQKHGKISGPSQKMFFSPSVFFFSPSVVLLGFLLSFIAFLGVSL